MNQQAPSIVKPALISGAIFGVISSIPLVGAINCACCALVIGAGVLAAKFQSTACRAAGVSFTGGGGAKVGLLAGVFHGLVYAVLGTIVNTVMGGAAQMEQVVDQLSGNPDVPPAVLEFLSSGAMSGAGLFFILLIVGLVTGLIFGSLGGLIGGSIFKVEPVGGAPAPPVPPPPAV